MPALPLLLALLLGAPSPAAQVERDPNLVLVVLDDVGIDRLSRYQDQFPAGYGADPGFYPPTPHFDALCDLGVRFTRAYASPLCSPSRACIQTGRAAFRHGMGSIPGNFSVSVDEITLPRMLAAAHRHGQPYASGTFGKWHLGRGDDPLHPIDLGYDVFQGYLLNLSAGDLTTSGDHFRWYRSHAWDNDGTPEVLVQEWIGVQSGIGVAPTLLDFESHRTVADAIAWIGGLPDDVPFLASVNMHAPHRPWQVPHEDSVSDATWSEIGLAGYRTRNGPQSANQVERARVFDWMIEAIDTEIGALVASLQSSGRWEDTILIVVGDNGTPIEIIDPALDGSHGKATVYELGTRAPLVVAGGLVEQAGVSTDALVHVTDLWATLADLVEVPTESIVVPADSVSFAHLIQNASLPGRRTTVLTQWFEPNGSYDPATSAHPHGKTLHERALRDADGHKVLRRIGTGGALEDTEEAYDLVEDFHEALDLTTFFLQPAWIGDLRLRLFALSGEGSP